MSLGLLFWLLMFAIVVFGFLLERDVASVLNRRVLIILIVACLVVLGWAQFGEAIHA